MSTQYAITTGDGVVRAEVEDRCNRWAGFLLSQFPKEYNFIWDRTAFAKWIYEGHPVGNASPCI